jgi:hypothetical protein
MRTARNVFIVNLAVSDLVIVMFNNHSLMMRITQKAKPFYKMQVSIFALKKWSSFLWMKMIVEMDLQMLCLITMPLTLVEILYMTWQVRFPSNDVTKIFYLWWTPFSTTFVGLLTLNVVGTGVPIPSFFNSILSVGSFLLEVQYRQLNLTTLTNMNWKKWQH